MSDCTDDKLHPLPPGTGSIPLPERFTWPFHYVPHELVRRAAAEVQDYLASCSVLGGVAREGKMFGVLVVRTSDDRTGYLAAFSGNLAGSNRHPFFVPPVYDLLQPDGFFRKEEAQISAINSRIKAMEESVSYLQAREMLVQVRKCGAEQLEQARLLLKKAKVNREEQRAQGIDEVGQAALIRESQFQKAEYKRLEKRVKARIQQAACAVEDMEEFLRRLKRERKERSAALQQKLFAQFRMLNAKGEEKDLCELFRDTPQGIPPAGAGECALPKLLQYAYQHGMKPLAMGEFWWGQSPKEEVRHQGYFYPSCRGKCAPILKHMLTGLQVDPDPLSADAQEPLCLETVYEDEWLVIVHKPAGMLSVPGKENTDSVWKRMRDAYPEATGPLVVHRLDMATSGLLVVAKDKDTHRKLQSLFAGRAMEKRYTALLEGEVSDEEGVVDLPVCPDPTDRPRQMVSREQGKRAVTRYKVTGRKDGNTLVAFFPLTGRTHQLRVHAAHPEGLGHPILGDMLYGHPADRLYLHAASLSFVHPVTGKQIVVCREADFGS